MALWALEQNAGVEWSTWYGDKNTSLKTCRLLKWSCFYLRQEQEFSRLVQTNLEVCLWHLETIKECLSEVEKGVTGTDFWKGFKLMNVDERLDQPWHSKSYSYTFIHNSYLYIFLQKDSSWLDERLDYPWQRVIHPLVIIHIQFFC